MANDIEIYFKGACTLQFTYNGKPDGSLQKCPTYANDVEIYWTKGSTGYYITTCYWTENGKVIGKCTVPTNPYPNDFTLKSTAISYVAWTYNNKVIQKIKAPTRANDVEFRLY